MRKYLFSSAVISAVFAVFGLLPRTIAGPKNWRLMVAWLGWLLGLVAAVLAVQEESHEVSDYYELRDAERAAKRQR